jgi:CBS domain-containing protein
MRRIGVRVETAAISYRVADFLKQHPPFDVVEESDLLQLAKQGRVRFYERHQYILAQGSSRVQVLVIQQGTVLLWDERGNEAKLLDVRGPGDLLGVDQLFETSSHPFAARSVSDVLVYAFPVADFNALLEKYPAAKEYALAYSSGRKRYKARQGHDPENVTLGELAIDKILPTCRPNTSIRAASELLIESGSDFLVVRDTNERQLYALSAREFLQWIARGEVDSEKPVASLQGNSPVRASNETTVADAVLAMADSNSDVLEINSDRFITARDIRQTFGEDPLELLDTIAHAEDVRSIRQLNIRARKLALKHLNTEFSAEWLAGFTSRVDISILRRIMANVAPESVAGCWCLCGSSGRGEHLTNSSPDVVFIGRDPDHAFSCRSALQRVTESFQECGYLAGEEQPFEPSFYVADVGEWTERFRGWITDPILKKFYQARPLFDLRPFAGDESLFHAIQASAVSSLNREFLHVIANDCLSTIPPLTFFKNAVVDEVGEETAVFRLEEDALRPVVDVGRVFGLAAGSVFRTSTTERFRLASALLPDNASIFEEAVETLRILLWQQGRAGIRQGTSGSEISPALLDPYHRQLLKRGFRSILRLIEFTGDLEWLKLL